MDTSNNLPLYTAFPFIPDEEALVTGFRQLLRSGMLTNRGPMVLQFEEDLLKHFGHANLSVVTCCNATLAMELTLRALGLRGKVIVPSFTFVATVHAVVNEGLEPVFADIDPNTFCISPKEIERLITPDTCAVLPVHVYGNVCDVEYLESLRKRGIRVIYDSAHVFGTRFHDAALGNWGDAEVFSFHATKILNACEGGAVTTRDPELAKRIKLLTNFGITNETEVDLIGTNAKMSEVHALFGRYSLLHLAQAIENRRKICSIYDDRLSGFSWLSPLKSQPGVRSNYQYYPVFLESLRVRDDLYQFFRTRNVFARKYFFPAIHLLAPYVNRYSAQLPVTEDTSNRVLCLPLHSSMREADAHHVCDMIEEFKKGR